MVPEAGFEPATQGFSILCSTNWAIRAINFVIRLIKDIIVKYKRKLTAKFIIAGETDWWELPNSTTIAYPCGEVSLQAGACAQIPTQAIA